MANRTEELEKLVVEQALEISRLSKVRTTPIRVREGSENTSQTTLLQVAKLDIFNLTEEIRVLKQQVRKKVRTIDNYKKQLTVEAKESNSLRARNNSLSNEKTLETVKYQQELMKTTTLNNENDKLSKAYESLRGAIIVDESKDVRNVRSNNDKRVVAILAENYEDFRYCQMLEREDVRSRTTYTRINHLQQLENRKGYDAIVRSESWTGVVRRDGRYNPNSIPDMKEFDAYLNKKTYGF